MQHELWSSLDYQWPSLIQNKILQKMLKVTSQIDDQRHLQRAIELPKDKLEFNVFNDGEIKSKGGPLDGRCGFFNVG